MGTLGTGTKTASFHRLCRRDTGIRSYIVVRLHEPNSRRPAARVRSPRPRP